MSAENRPNLPSHYTFWEGGCLQPWRYGFIPNDFFAKRDYHSVDLRSKIFEKLRHDTVMFIHSLVFTDNTSKEVARWDCVNGWND